MVSSENTDKAVSEDECGESTHTEEIEWLASLSEHETDFLISLKDMASTRAENMGHKGFTKKFDLKVLRALAFVLLEYFKDRLRNMPDISIGKLLESLNECILLDLNCDGNTDIMTSESKSSILDIGFVCSKRKRMWDNLQELSSSSSKKQKTTYGGSQ